MGRRGTHTTDTAETQEAEVKRMFKKIPTALLRKRKNSSLTRSGLYRE